MSRKNIRKKQLYLDQKKQFMRCVQQCTPFCTNFYQRYWAFNTYPKRFEDINEFDDNQQLYDKVNDLDHQEQCYLYFLQNLGSIYQPLYDQFEAIVGYRIQLQQPNQLKGCFFRKVCRIYQQFTKFNKHLIIKYVFGNDSENIQNFYKSYIQNRQYQKINNIQIKQLQKYKKSSKSNLKIIQQSLNRLNIKTGDSKFQDLLKMARDLKNMFGFEIHGQMYQKEQQKKSQKIIIINPKQQKNKTSNQERKKNQKQLNKIVIIKSDMIQNKRSPKYQINQLIFESLYQQQVIKKQKTTSQSYLAKQYMVQKTVRLSKVQFQDKKPLFKLKFIISITEQILQYQMLTGAQYPRLHPQNIYYNSIPDNFILSQIPVIIEALGYKNHTYSSKFRPKYDEQQTLQRGFSLQKRIDNNSERLILLMCYLQIQKFRVQQLEIKQIKEPKQWLKGLFQQIPQQQWQKLQQIRKKKYIQFQNTQYDLQKQEKTSTSTIENSFQSKKYKLNRQKRQQNKSYICNAQILKEIIKQNIFSKIILIQSVSYKRLPTLIQIDQVMHLNCHISDLSPTRSEYVLHMRFCFMDFIYKFVQDATNHLMIDKQNAQIKKLKAELKISQKLIFTLLIIVSLQLKTVLRKQDVEIEQDVNKFLRQFLDYSKSIDTMQSNFQQAQKNTSEYRLFCQFYQILKNKLIYVCRNLQNQQLMMNLNYSKVLWKLISLCVKNQSFTKIFIDIYTKYYDQTKERHLQLVTLVIKIIFDSLLKLNHENVFWFEYFVFNKIKEFFIKKRLNKGYLQQIHNNVIKKPITKINPLWQGIVWKQQKRCIQIYSD